ncbi:voltage-dependent anion channel [Suillus clintonianus]|uniref:voltage-dependent anion channel n=1 Tax=Suillus clintonianus TaxID=1904413 RepID=UPI001B87099B|nr:voltage-dependent anion channel [Suillus clintonianus]KAG2126308.1 voltage-dependent anion channel [Suillus clintonianus]
MLETPPRKSCRECIRNFTWAWYTVIMGTGGTSALVHAFPYGNDSPAIKAVTLVIFSLNLLLFVLFTGATIARYIMFPDIWLKMIRHPAQGPLMGAFPAGAATLINIALVANQEWKFGRIEFLYTLWGFWWFDSILSYLIAFGMLHAMMVEQKHALQTMTPLWLLPAISLIVASSTGGLLSAALKAQSMKFAILTTLFSFTMVIIGLSLALMMITVYLARLIINGPPEKPLVLSAFVALGPFGQGGYSLLINGQNLSEILPLHVSGTFPGVAAGGQMIFSFCFCGSYILWSMGVCWSIISSISIFSVLKKEGNIPFSIAYQGLIFPNAVFALLSVQLGNVLNSGFFCGFGAAWTVIVFILWLSIFARTILAVVDRSIFVAPDIAVPPLPLDSNDSLDSIKPAGISHTLARQQLSHLSDLMPFHTNFVKVVPC